MNRAEFMAELTRLLQNIPENERVEALKYYDEYFNDAGEENEQQVIAELESPQKVADKIITVKQENGAINRIHITPEYVEMESSTCENQDCIGEGEVNVNTYKDRILSTYIICLPNQVTIEMVPADE